MEELLYSDLNGKYFLLDYSPSHSEIVIRRINKSDSNNIFNIDLFFKSVDNMNIATKLSGINIYKVARNNDLDLMSNHYERKEIYKIVDSVGNIGFVDAGVFVVFHNKLDLLTTSLGDFTWSNENVEVFSNVIN
ncbi:MAG: hypothetical protein J7604_09645 [Sporocytophaga sp.]|uniref:hypothetical protein n=1 Tax=Sporocytophaga sp. TaxID=2231183 RepID=UPI001B132424|nr:hypothetical protein [Sporocytophaga sp.]MBO9700459.1 hypothetical protein [Sporocytophaga sp.]